MQDYSIRNQSETIARYAAARGIRVVRTYADEGRSGLDLAGRDGLQQLLADVEGRNAEFTVLLIYDVSRWGRFQDTDESAYYEYLCRRANIRVEYCAEPFLNDGSPLSAIMKSMKRAMAAEYSRELSAKVLAGHRRLVLDGFHQGGRAGYGLRRLLIDAGGQPRTVLRPGEQKSIKTDRIVLVPGPEGEVAIVREIFSRFALESWSVRMIVEWLNESKILSDVGRPWTEGAVRHLLRNERYLGHVIYGKSEGRLRSPRRRTQKHSWLRSEGRFPGVIEASLFNAAQEKFRQLKTYSDEHMIAVLRKILETHGRITTRLINSTAGAPHPSLYKQRFRGLTNAYLLAGYRMPRETLYIQKNRKMRTGLPDVAARLAQVLARRELEVTVGGSRINFCGWSIEVLGKRGRARGGHLTWEIPYSRTDAEMVVIARYNPEGTSPIDFYLVPFLLFSRERFILAPSNGFYIDLFRFKTLEELALAIQSFESWA